MSQKRESKSFPLISLLGSLSELRSFVVFSELKPSLPCSLDASLLSPDSSYVCYSSSDAGAPCCCRRSPRLLTNGYYDVTEDSFCLDEDGNVSLTGCRTNVSYKENLVR